MSVLDGYIRVSQVGGREGEGFISPDVQEQAIRRWAEQNGHEVVIQKPELDQSGGTMNRPVFNSILARIRAGETSGLVVYKLDRFARTVRGALEVIAELGEHDAMFASATEPTLDYATPAGRAFVQQMFVFAEFVRSTTKESWYTAQRHAIERGIHISPSTFLGYDKGDDGRLVRNDLAPVAREMFLRRGRRQTWGQIADWLNEVAPRDDGKLWTPQAPQRLCANRVYRGEASRYVAQDVDRRGPVVNKTAHPTIVSEAEWQAAQMTQPPVGGRKPGEPGALLSGLVRCSGCRFQLSIGQAPKTKERVYRCRPKKTTGTCGCPTNVMADTLEAHIEETILAQIDGLTRIVPDSGERDRAVAALNRARDDLEGFRQDREARRQLGASVWNEWLADYLTAVRRAEADLAALDTRHGMVKEGLTREHYLALPVSDRREVLAGFIDAVMVRKSHGRGRHVDPIAERVRILWSGDAPDDLPRPRVASPIVPFSFEEHDIEAGVVAAQDAA